MIRYIPPFILHNYELGRLGGSFEGFALCFDLADFTRVCASLQKAGKDGAETLSLLLEAAFEEPLALVDAAGGFVTHFEGDSFHAVFPGVDAHQVGKLVRALCDLYAQPREFSTGQGSFGLKARLSVSYGEIEWLILNNDLQNEYVFMGEPFFELATLNGLKKDLAMSPGALSILGPHTGPVKKRNPEKGLAPIKPYSRQSAYPFSQQTARSFLQARLHGIKPENEFRNVVCCFAHLDWPEPGMLSKASSHMELIAVTFPVYVNKIIADRAGLLAVGMFGIPYNEGDIAERACSGALETMKSIRGLSLVLTAGKVFAGHVGSREIREYTALGHVMNLASRLAGLNRCGEIIVDSSLQREMEGKFIFEQLPAGQVRGLGAPVRAYRLTGKHDRSFIRFRGGFVGREAELAWLQKTVNAFLAKGESCVIYIQGEPGIGKTRLVHEALKSLGSDGCRKFMLSCDFMLAKPLDPVRQLLSQLLGLKEGGGSEGNVQEFRAAWRAWAGPNQQLQECEAAIASLLGNSWEGSNWTFLSPDMRLERQKEAWAAMLRAEASRNQVLIHLDDAQWLDPQSLELIQALDRATLSRICILASSRYLENGVWLDLRLASFVPRRLNLKPLNFSGSVRLYKSLLGLSKLPSGTLTMIRTESTGNPFFIEQYVYYMLENGRINEKGEILQYLEPSDLFSPADIIGFRIDRLTDKVRECVYNASVLGLKFNVNVLSQMLNSDPGEALASGAKNQIWKDLDEVFFIFSHMLIQETIYNRMMGDKLKKLHQSAAAAMERVYELNLDEQAEAIAGHYEKAGLADKAAAYYDRAGGYYWDKCLFERSESCTKEAIRLCAEACGKDNTCYSEKVFHLALLCHYLQRMDEAEKLYAEVMAVVSKAYGASDPRLSPYVNNLGRFYKDVGRFAESEKLLKRSLRMEQKQCPESSNVADRLNNLGHLYTRQKMYAQAEEMYLAAFSIMDQHYDPDHFFMGTLCNNLGGTYLQDGRYDEAERMFERAISIANKRWGKEHPSTAVYLKNMGNLHFKRQNWQQAADYYHKALNIYHRSFGSRHPNTLIVVSSLRELYEKTGDKSALKVYAEWEKLGPQTASAEKEMRKQKK